MASLKIILIIIIYIYFLEGNNSDIKFSAGTGIYEDNEFKKPLLIPTTLNNGCLLYKTSNTHNFFTDLIL